MHIFCTVFVLCGDWTFRHSLAVDIDVLINSTYHNGNKSIVCNEGTGTITLTTNISTTLDYTPLCNWQCLTQTTTISGTEWTPLPSYRYAKLVGSDSDLCVQHVAAGHDWFSSQYADAYNCSACITHQNDTLCSSPVLFDVVNTPSIMTASFIPSNQSNSFGISIDWTSFDQATTIYTISEEEPFVAEWISPGWIPLAVGNISEIRAPNIATTYNNWAVSVCGSDTATGCSNCLWPDLLWGGDSGTSTGGDGDDGGGTNNNGAVGVECSFDPTDDPNDFEYISCNYWEANATSDYERQVTTTTLILNHIDKQGINESKLATAVVYWFDELLGLIDTATDVAQAAGSLEQYLSAGQETFETVTATDGVAGIERAIGTFQWRIERV